MLNESEYVKYLPKLYEYNEILNTEYHYIVMEKLGDTLEDVLEYFCFEKGLTIENATKVI